MTSSFQGASSGRRREEREAVVGPRRPRRSVERAQHLSASLLSPGKSLPQPRSLGPSKHERPILRKAVLQGGCGRAGHRLGPAFPTLPVERALGVNQQARPRCQRRLWAPFPPHFRAVRVACCGPMAPTTPPQPAGPHMGLGVTKKTGEQHRFVSKTWKLLLKCLSAL